MRRKQFLCGMLWLLAALSGCRGEPAPVTASSPSAIAPAAQPSGAAPAPSSAEAPAPVAASATAAAPAPSTLAALPQGGAGSAASAAGGSGGAGASPTAQAGDSAQEPALLAPDGTPLPQTEERPSVTAPRFHQRIQLLADAIVTGDFEKARATFFPLVAYAQVKDVQKPERDYRYRLLANFERDVREYRKALGKDAAGAELIGIDVPEARVEWMKPGREGNRLGYFRVLRSKLRFRLKDGKERSFELTSMISWRGEWYVVHLHGFE